MEILALVFSIISLMVSAIIAVKGWWRHRNIYDVERKLLFRESQINKTNNNDDLKKKLSSGKYTILHTGKEGGYIELILGKLKK